MLEVKMTDKTFSNDRHKTAARALIIKDNKLLVLYSKKYKFYQTPGGGIEEGEDLEDACIREAQEETGSLVAIYKKIGTLKANYKHITISHHYYLCHYLGQDKTNLTKDEQDQDLIPQWLTYEEAKQAFSMVHDTEVFDKWMQREYVMICELRQYMK
jgi:8-oxo-dGTP diphosphatase